MVLHKRLKDDQNLLYSPCEVVGPNSLPNHLLDVEIFHDIRFDQQMARDESREDDQSQST